MQEKRERKWMDGWAVFVGRVSSQRTRCNAGQGPRKTHHQPAGSRSQSQETRAKRKDGRETMHHVNDLRAVLLLFLSCFLRTMSNGEKCEGEAEKRKTNTTASRWRSRRSSPRFSYTHLIPPPDPELRDAVSPARHVHSEARGLL